MITALIISNYVDLEDYFMMAQLSQRDFYCLLLPLLLFLQFAELSDWHLQLIRPRLYFQGDLQTIIIDSYPPGYSFVLRFPLPYVS